MSTPVPVTTGSGAVVQGTVSRPVTPTAISGQVPSAVYSLGVVLKELIQHSTAFKSEGQVLAAFQGVETFLKAFVPASALPALMTGDERASVEDVSKRVPPNGVAFSVPTNLPAIDYDRLAMAMVRAQQQIAAESAPVTEPEPVPVQSITDVPPSPETAQAGW